MAEFSENFQGGGVIFNPKIYIADFGKSKQGFLSKKLNQKSNSRVCIFNNCIEKNQNNTPSEEGSTQCAGNLFKTKLMSQYISSGQKILRNLRIQELVLKVQNHGVFLRKKPF